MKAPIDFFRVVIQEMIPFHKHLGLRLEEAEDGYVLLRVPFQEALVGDPRVRRLHGGLVSMAIDAAGGAAGMTLLTSEQDQIATLDMRVDFLRPGQADDLLVWGRVVRASSRTIVTRMEAFHPGRPDQVLAEGRGVYSLRRKQDECDCKEDSE